jgi:hypothetical protein
MPSRLRLPSQPPFLFFGDVTTGQHFCSQPTNQNPRKWCVLIGSNPKGGATSNKQWSHQEKGAMKQKKLSQRFDIPFQCLFIPKCIVHLLFFFHFTALSCEGNGRFFE